jgi:hypothetical protein
VQRGANGEARSPGTVSKHKKQDHKVQNKGIKGLNSSALFFSV